MNLLSARMRHKKFTEERRSRGRESRGHGGRRPGGWVLRGESKRAKAKEEEEDFKTEFDVACSKELAS